MSKASEPFWINPCGLENINIDNSETPAAKIAERELIEHMNTVRLGAIIHANQLLEKFAEQQFSMNASTVHEMFKSRNNSWIHPLPKGLNETVSEEHLKSLEFPNILLDMYAHLQTIAVGLEQMILDTDPKDELYGATSHAKDKLKAVLCEFQEAMLTLGLAMRSDVERKDMPDSERAVDLTRRRKRDWISLREYVNALEYLEQVFNHMLKRYKE